MKKVFFSCLVALFFPLMTTAQSRGNGEYALTGYKIDMTVNENNSFFVTERITVYYHVPKYGIDRLIPMSNEVDRLDGTKSRNRAKISNIDVPGNPFRVYNEGGNKVIELGGNDNQITGSKAYVVTYLYDIGKDRGKGFDEFYFNLIGLDWDTTIDEIEFSITMPKSFDASKLGFSSGIKGSTFSGNVTFEVEGNVISGRYNGTLRAGEALTVRLELPDGYFVGAENALNVIALLSIIGSCFFVLVALGLWYTYGRGERPVVTVEFYPPEGFNSAEVGFLYHGAAEVNDVVSLLIYLANKGYIQIEEIEEKTLFAKKDGFKITKLKDYDGDNPNERLFLTGLFKTKASGMMAMFQEIAKMSKDTKQMTTNPEAMAEFAAKTQGEEKREVTSADLKNNFYATLNSIVANLNSKANKYTLFEKSSINKNFYFYLMAIATLVLVTYQPVMEYGGIEELLFALPFTGIGLILFILFTIVRPPMTITVNGKPTRSQLPAVLFGLAFGVMFGGIMFVYVVLPALLMDEIYLLAYIIGMIGITIIFFCMKYTKKRTPYGNELLGKIKGFKDFLEQAEKPKLEELVMQNPAYFYHILPFTYVLGVSDKWIKKFETIALQAPHWYRGRKAFNSASFGRFMSTTMTNASKAMSSSPSSSSGSGGGRSGGGSGGGGGRSR